MLFTQSIKKRTRGYLLQILCPKKKIDTFNFCYISKSITVFKKKIMSKFCYKLMLLLVLIFPLVGTSQTSTTDKTIFPDKILSVKLGADDPWLGVTYEKLISQSVGLEGQIGFFGASFGVKYYFLALENKKINFSAGISPGLGLSGGKVYFPVAVNFWLKGNYRISFDMGPTVNFGSTNNIPNFSLKIGKGL